LQSLGSGGGGSGGNEGVDAEEGGADPKCDWREIEEEEEGEPPSICVLAQRALGAGVRVITLPTVGSGLKGGMEA
jgi:hypothetical protein